MMIQKEEEIDKLKGRSTNSGTPSNQGLNSLNTPKKTTSSLTIDLDS